MSKLKIRKAKFESWQHFPDAIGHIVSHGWTIKWKDDDREVVGYSRNRLLYAEFEYGYLRFRKIWLKHYKTGWRCLMDKLYGEDHE